MGNIRFRFVSIVVMMAVLVAACSEATPTPAPKIKVGLVIDSGSENDKSFNQYTLQGAREAADASGMDFSFISPRSTSDYEIGVQRLIGEGSDLIITVGFRMGDVTAKAAQQHPELRFAIVDNAYLPGAGCADTVEDCYTEEGGLANVTSLMFAEDEVGYLAGVLAACMTNNDVIATVAGLEIPPVWRFVTGYQTGARSLKPEIVTLNQYIPDFNDPDTGMVVAQDFINQGADVIFGVGGNTGNGGLLAAFEADLMAIGVDIDQYFTYPEVSTALLTSAAKNMDVAAAAAVRDFAAGQLGGGIRLATLANGGVGLAPYHDWDERIPASCKEAVTAAEQAVKDDATITGAK